MKWLQYRTTLQFGWNWNNSDLYSAKNYVWPVFNNNNVLQRAHGKENSKNTVYSTSHDEPYSLQSRTEITMVITDFINL